MQRILFILALWIAGCTTLPGGVPATTPIAIATISCKSVATLAKSMSAGINADLLKGKDADNAISDLIKAKAVCDAGVVAAIPASGASK